MLPPMDVSLDMPSTHAGGRRKVGEGVGAGRQCSGWQEGEVKVGCSVHVKFLSTNFSSCVSILNMYIMLRILSKKETWMPSKRMLLILFL